MYTVPFSIFLSYDNRWIEDSQNLQLKLTSCDIFKCTFLNGDGNHGSPPAGRHEVSNPNVRIYLVLLVTKPKVDTSVKSQNCFQCISHQRQVGMPTLQSKCLRKLVTDVI